MNMLFSTLAEKFMIDGAARKRKPLRPSSLRAYRSDLDTQLLPFFGQKQVQAIDGEQVKALVAQMAEHGLSGSSITRKVSLLKKILRSLRDKNGNQILSASWSSEYLDCPENSTTVPTITQQSLSAAFLGASTSQRALYALLAASGLRIAEALAVRIGPDDGISTIWIPSESKIIVRVQRTREGVGPTKTKAGRREIDLCSELNNFLSETFIDLFTNACDPNSLLFPKSEDFYRDQLEKDGIQGGFHSFRRFRITYLRLFGVPQPLVDFWDGHSGQTMSERYTRIGGELQARKEWAEKAGLGFKLEGL